MILINVFFLVIFDFQHIYNVALAHLKKVSMKTRTSYHCYCSCFTANHRITFSMKYELLHHLLFHPATLSALCNRLISGYYRQHSLIPFEGKLRFKLKSRTKMCLHYKHEHCD